MRKFEPSPSDPVRSDQLDRAIDDELVKLGVSAPPPACAAAAACGAVVPEPLSVTPPTRDPQCSPGPRPACQDTCTLSDSICSNARRICDLAAQLGGDDAYANEKCAKGKASCDAAGERCCSCV